MPIQKDTKPIFLTSCFGFCTKYRRIYERDTEFKRLIRFVDEREKEIKRIMKHKVKSGNIGSYPHSLPVIRYSNVTSYISFKSREFEYKNLLDALRDENNFITVLQGMTGIGKTSMALEVIRELEKFERFTHFIYVTVSFTPNIKEIKDAILESFGLNWKDYSESDKTIKILNRLTNGEKILLLMDDMWGQFPLDFEEIGIPNSDNHKGCRVLVTSRSKQIFNTMSCVKRIELDLLSEEDAWIMFQKYSCMGNRCPRVVISIGREIAKECKQLPAAIAIIGSSLRGHRVMQEWAMKLRSLKKHVSYHGVDDDMVELYEWLKVSYDYIKGEEAKELFLLFSVLGENEEISVEVLTRFSIGAGLFEEDYRAREKVVVAKNKLLDSYLLLGVGEKNVKMHGLVRDMAQWIKEKEIQKSLVERKVNIQYLSCEGKDKGLFSSKFDDSKLEILIVKVDSDKDHKCMEVPTSFFENMAKLRVLCFSGNDDYPLLSLPNSIQSLTNIRSILIKTVDLGDISIMGKLQSLETLELIQCTINELPKEIANLEKFKLLNLEHCVISSGDPFEVIKRCSSLEGLYFIDSFNCFCGEITLPQLRRYQICKGWAVWNNWLSKCVVFPINGDAYRFSKETFNYCMQTAEVLLLNGIKGKWRNLMPEIVPINLGMNDLVELCLSCVSQIQLLVDTIGYQMPNVLSKLVVLKLDRIENLKELFNGALSVDCLTNLEKVSIKDCKHLRSLFKCKLNLFSLKVIELQNCPMLVSLFSQRLTSGSLVLLETLKIAHCERLKNIIVDEKREEESSMEMDDEDNSNEYHGLMFPKLKVLDIEGCPLLESIFPFLFAQDIPVIQTIKIKRCDGLKYVFGVYQHVEFRSLRQLELCHSPNFTYMFRESKHLISSSVKGSTSSIPLVDVEQPHDNSLALESNSYRFHIWERTQCLQIQSMILYNIRKIELSHISKIKSVFIVSVVPKLLVESLTIRNCDELKHIIDFGDYDSGSNNWGNIFPKLEELYIEGCTQLKYILGRDTLDQENHLKILLRLPKLKFLSLRNLSSLVAICPKKYRIKFPPSAKLELIECPLATIKSIGNFKMHPVSESLDSTIIKEYGDDQIAIPSSSSSTKEPHAGKVEGSEETNQNKNLGSLDDDAFIKVSSTTNQQFPKGFPNGTEVEATSGYEINIDQSNEFEIMETKKKQPTKGKQEFVVNVPTLKNQFDM
ncbi:disease resistance protein At4g27190-like [Vicia villosa]|uniref:disease resistance protein At4g27190-like n=1 Tax=Vicia villosa TaxID=3911 RepID=UPI00273B2316|nr:disease resistance protein At4g27190-like [Vicia villosa]